MKKKSKIILIVVVIVVALLIGYFLLSSSTSPSAPAAGSGITVPPRILTWLAERGGTFQTSFMAALPNMSQLELNSFVDCLNTWDSGGQLSSSQQSFYYPFLAKYSIA